MNTKRVRGTLTISVEFLYTPDEYGNYGGWAPSRIVQALQELTRGEASQIVTEKHEVVYLSYDLEDI